MTIDEAMAAQGLKAAELASRVGVSASHMSLIISRKRRPSAPVAARIEAELEGVNAMDLLLAPLEPAGAGA